MCHCPLTRSQCLSSLIKTQSPALQFMRTQLSTFPNWGHLFIRACNGHNSYNGSTSVCGVDWVHRGRHIGQDKTQVIRLTWWISNKLPVISYNNCCHESTPSVGGLTSKTLCCLLESRKQADGDMPAAMTPQSSSPRGGGIFTRHSVSNVFPWSLTRYSPY